jgi:outer membrane protein
MNRLFQYACWTFLIALPLMGDGGPLTLEAARRRALRTHPRVTVAELETVAARAGVKEARAAFLPWASFNATAVGTGEDQTRISAGALNNPQVFDRAGFGAAFTQLITDFGRTARLTGAARAEAGAAATNQAAVRALLLAETDAAFFNTLRSRALREVAMTSLASRRLVLAQVSALATNELKSRLDVSFAEVSESEGQLLLDQAETDVQTALVTLGTLIGATNGESLAPEEAPAPAELPADASGLISDALAHRPDLAAARLHHEGLRQRARAENALDYPTLSAFGTAGITPLHDLGFQHQYSAAGVNLNIPLFSGGLYTARQHRAEALASADEARVRDFELEVVRGVRMAWLSARQAKQQIRTAQTLVAHANQALQLAEARYERGLASMVELNQAQVAQTTAAMTEAGARYTYQLLRDRLDYETGALSAPSALQFPP